MTRDLMRARSRQAFLFVLIGVAMLAIIGRLVYWQIGLHAALAARANQEHERPFVVPAGRGSIYDSNGKLLALNITEDAVEADPQAIKQEEGQNPGSFEQTMDHLATILNISSDVLRPQLQLSQNGQPVTFTYLHDANDIKIHATQQQSDQINQLLNNNQLWGIGLLPESWRVYLDDDLAAQLLGFVRQDNGEGQYGLEKYYNALLAGKPGKLITDTDVSGNPLPIGQQVWQPPVNGADLKLTLDANVQLTVEQMLHDTIVQRQADGGSVIIVNPKTGAIIAMASEPGFDPNNYSAVTSYQLFTNPAVSSIYDPGSTMKAVTMAAGIDLHLITPDTTLDDPGYYTLDDGTTLHNFDGVNYGQETMTQVLQHSANVGAIWVALTRLHANNFYHYLSQFGFGAQTGVDLPTEDPGQVPPPAQRDDLTLAENSFGESIGVTPLQMVMAYAALANGGLLMQPYVVASITQNGHVTTTTPHSVRQTVSPQTAQTVTQMLVQSAMNGEASQALVPGYQIAAKTGTSTPDPDAPDTTFASVAGYAPASNPQFVMLVKIDHPKNPIFGGLVAGPLWHDIAAWLFHYYRIAPDQPAGKSS